MPYDFYPHRYFHPVMKTILVISITGFVLFAGFFTAFAAEDFIQDLNDQINDRRSSADQLNRQIENYQKKINQKRAERISLQNQTDILENRVAKTELEIELTNEQIKTAFIELRIFDVELQDLEKQVLKQKNSLKLILQEIQTQDNSSPLEFVFSDKTFSEIFDEIHALENVNQDLNSTLDKAKERGIVLSGQREQKQSKLDSLEDLEDQLEIQQFQFSEEKAAKEILIASTAASEVEFQALLKDLKAEQQYIESQIAALQYDIEARLNEQDVLGDISVLSWPVIPKKGISAYYHDPTYPYRHLFEHSGIDLPAGVGTPVKAAGPGYVAWTREGRQYGYYVMIIHTNGVATLYAHLSKILVEADQFVTRGDVIALSGGRAGAKGSGLSTGPHLHFEARKNGIPVNPLNYLIEL